MAVGGPGGRGRFVSSARHYLRYVPRRLSSEARFAFLHFIRGEVLRRPDDLLSGEPWSLATDEYRLTLTLTLTLAYPRVTELYALSVVRSDAISAP